MEAQDLSPHGVVQHVHALGRDQWQQFIDDLLQPPPTEELIELLIETSNSDATIADFTAMFMATTFPRYGSQLPTDLVARCTPFLKSSYFVALPTELQFAIMGYLGYEDLTSVHHARVGVLAAEYRATGQGAKTFDAYAEKTLPEHELLLSVRRLAHALSVNVNGSSFQDACRNSPPALREFFTDVCEQVPVAVTTFQQVMTDLWLVEDALKATLDLASHVHGVVSPLLAQIGTQPNTSKTVSTAGNLLGALERRFIERAIAFTAGVEGLEWAGGTLGPVWTSAQETRKALLHIRDSLDHLMHAVRDEEVERENSETQRNTDRLAAWIRSAAARTSRDCAAVERHAVFWQDDHPVFDEAVLADGADHHGCVIEIWSPQVEHHRLRPKRVLTGVRVTVTVPSLVDYRVALRHQVNEALRARMLPAAEFRFA